MDYYKNTVQYIRETDQGTKVFTIIDPFPTHLVTPQHDSAVLIAWKYQGAMPSKEQIFYIANFEKTIFPLIKTGDHLVTHSITGNGKREICHYTNDVDKFQLELRQCLAGLEGLPLEIRAFKDPKWSYHDSVISMAKAGASFGKAA